MNLTFASQLFSKLEGRVQKGGRGRGTVVEMRVAGKGERPGAGGRGESENGEGPGRAEVGMVPSSASSSSSTPVSWHFLLWAFDFMCLVRFPGKT